MQINDFCTLLFILIGFFCLDFTLQPYHVRKPTICSYDLALIKCNRRQQYTIHGLWPEGCNGAHWPQFCNGPCARAQALACNKFNLTQIDDLLNEMKVKWKSCNDRDISFWKHEWTKHGTCTGMDQFTYFNTTLYLYDVANELEIIEEYCLDDTLECKIPITLNLTFLLI